LACELHRDRRNDVEGLGDFLLQRMSPLMAQRVSAAMSAMTVAIGGQADEE